MDKRLKSTVAANICVEGRLFILWMSLVVVGFSMLLSGCSQEPAAVDEETVSDAAAAAPAYAGTIVAMGDSLTAGLGVDADQAYPAQLARRLAADGHNYRVINAGVSGETSSGALSRVDWVISSLSPDIVILETGANDGLRGIDPTLLEANLDNLCAIFEAHHIEVILAGMLMLPNLGPDYTKAFARIYPRIAEKHDVRFIPFFLEGVAGKDDLNQSDRLHPTAQGYAVIARTVYPYVLEAIKQLEKGQPR
jgi:acyl-CoA thioesterase I